MMETEVILTSRDNAYIIGNLWRLYLYDLAEFDHALPNIHGLFEDDDVRIYDDRADRGIWWEKPGLLFPYLIRADGHAAGFAMAGASPGHAPKGRDYFLHEFFLARPFRAKGIGEAAVRQIFDDLPGLWELRAMLNNPRAQGFWRKALGRYTAGRFEEEERYVEEEDAMKVVFTFSNRASDPLSKERAIS